MAPFEACHMCLRLDSPNQEECKWGHTICATCKGQLKKCPTCNAEFGNVSENNIIITKKGNCEYKGCDKLLCYRKYCLYRPTKCLYCNVNLRVIQLKHHYTESHREKTLFILGTDPGYWSKQNMQSNSTLVSLFYYPGHYFWRKMYIDRPKRLFIVKFGQIPTGMKHFYVNIVFEKGLHRLSACTEVAMMRDYDNIDNALPNFTVPLHIMSKFIDMNGHLKYYKMEIFEKLV